MGKASSRKAKQRTSAHEAISDENAEMARRAMQRLIVRDAEEMPATAALLDSATAALGNGIPARFEHEGKTYFMRVSIGLARFEIFDSPATETPITEAVQGSYAVYGHKPGH